MPFITPKKTVIATAALIWDAFPPPPPEAETWQPDPDSIARPGGLPDSRFNRDPEQDRRSKSFRKEARMNGHAQSGTESTPSTSGSALGRGLGEWPAPAPRSTGYPRGFVPTVEPTSPPLDSASPFLPVKVDFQTSGSLYKQSSKTTKPAARITGPPKGTMELLPAPNYRRPETPATSKASTKSVSPSKSIPPAWVASLEMAFAEDDRKLNALVAATSTTTSQISPRPETARKESIPPHLRGKNGDEGKTRPQLISKQTPSLNLNPDVKVYEGLVMRGDSNEALALATAIAEPGVEHAKHSLRMQQDMLDRYIAKHPTPPTIPVAIPSTRAHLNHDIKIKVILIRAMEHEMDLDKVAPERELIAMQRAELDRYHDKVYSVHQQWWEAKGNA